eukprot:6208980-Pleurochrysis_carterae.AAC.2
MASLAFWASRQNLTDCPPCPLIAPGYHAGAKQPVIGDFNCFGTGHCALEWLGGRQYVRVTKCS